MDESGWNFRHGKYHEENKRSLFKTYGLKVQINVSGSGRKFDLTKTIIIVFTGLGLMGLANVLCDLVLLHCNHDFRDDIRKKKYEEIYPILDEKLFADNLMKLLQKQENPGEAIETLKIVSSIALMHTEKEFMPLSKEI